MPRSRRLLRASRQFRLHMVATCAVLACFSVGAISHADAGSTTVRFLVKFQHGTPPAVAADALGRARADVIGSVRDLDISVVSIEAADRGPALAALRSDHNVAFAEPDALLQPQEVLPNDPYFPQDYALDGGAWGWYQTHTTQAWDITEGDPSIVIAILDTGLRTTGLSDFDGQLVPGWNTVSNSSDTSSTAGVHGTYVAGAAGLALGNGTGNAGFCPGCKIMPVQVGSDSGALLSNIASGLTWAADHGARVANMSWAGSSTSATLQSAINYAHSKGMVLTAAAGNSNCNCPTYPAAYAGVIAVGGTSSSGSKQGDSNYGSWVTLAAPEGSITAWPTINGAPGYAGVGGTSLAAPVVAGIAGLLFSYDHTLSNAQVEQALEQSAAAVPFSVQYGRVDALAALKYLGASDPQASSAPVQTTAPQLYYELNGWTAIAPLTASPQPGQVLVRGFGGWRGSSGLNVTGLQWQRCDTSGLNCVALTSAATYAVQTADTGFTIKLVFTVKNAIGSVLASALTQPVGGTAPPPPAAPVNTALPTISGTPQDGQTVATSVGTWSGSPTAYTFQWSRCDSSGGACTAVSGATTASYPVQTADVGDTLRVAVTASNATGSASATSVATTLVAPAPPPPPATTETLTFSGSLNPGNPSRSFTFTAGAGATHAQLTFSKCSSLALSLSNGASTSGPSVVKLDSTLATAGSNTFQVSGGRCSFTLTVTAPSP